jgi:ABC-2 type transport system permease protein
MVITGSFDLILVKPVSPLLRILLGGTDLLDFITLIPFILAIIYITSKIPSVSVVGVVGYILLIFNSLIISAAFHIFVMALGILTTEVDNAIMIYRDLTSMGKVPVDIYKEPIKSVTTYILPIGIMMTFPVKVLIGMLDIKIVIFSIMLGLTILKLSHILWQYSLNRYTSASS